MISRFANPARFMRFSATALPWCGCSAAIVLAVGLYLALVAAPPDYQQGEAVRIMYVHVPAAWMALAVYLFVAVASAVALVWRHPLAEIAARAAAPIGAAFTFVCLASGSLWGRPMWGAWWVWDARLTSVLVLFFLYLGYIALVNAFDEPGRGAQGGLGAGAGRGRQPADHQILGRLVEHLAPAGERHAARRPTDRPLDAGSAAGDGGGLPAVVPGAADAPHADRPERTQGARDAPQQRSRAGAASRDASGRCRPIRLCTEGPVVGAIGLYLAMGGYAAFVWPAYGVALAVLGGLTWQSWRRYRASASALERLQRELGTRR